jgi:hypothetical protein
VNRITLSLTLTTCTLSCRSTLLLDLEQGSLGMGTSRDPMSFDARRASEFLLVDEYHTGNLGRGEVDDKQAAHKLEAVRRRKRKDQVLLAVEGNHDSVMKVASRLYLRIG